MIALLNNKLNIFFTTCKIYFNIIVHPRVVLENGLLSSVFYAEMFYAFLTCTINSTCPTNLIPIDLIILVKFTKERKL